MLDAHDPCFFETVSKGAMWEVISSEVVAHFDTLVPLAQSACNVGAQVSQNETELQICRKILAFMKDGACPNYDEIAPMILRSRPRNAQTVPSLYQFMVRFGSSSHYLRTEAYVRTHGQSSRVLDGKVWDALSMESKMKGQEQCLLWRHAMLKALLCHHDKLIAAGDIRKSLTAKEMLAKVQTFESILLELTGIAKGVPTLSVHQVDEGLGCFEVEGVVSVLGKTKAKPHAVYTPADDVRVAAHKCILYWRGCGAATLASPYQAFVDSLEAKAVAARGSAPPPPAKVTRTMCLYSMYKRP